MKIIFEFDKLEDEYDLKVHLQANDMHRAIDDFLGFLRQKIKYTDEENTTYEAIKEKFWEFLTDNNVKTDL